MPDTGYREPSRSSTRRPRTVAGYSPKVEPWLRAVSASSLNQPEMVGGLELPGGMGNLGLVSHRDLGSADTGPLPGSHGTRAFPDSG